jgi:hypothetical protein
MAPVLFLFLMTAFAETLEIVWKEWDIPILCVMTTVNEHIAEGKICSHTPAMFKSKKLTAYEILQCLYVDDGAFSFGTREDLQRGMELIFPHFARFGLEMHIGRGASESKTECVFFPPFSSSSAWRRPTPQHAQSNKRSGEHNEHTPWHVLWRNILPRTRYPPHQSYHCLHRLRASPSYVVSSLLRPIHSTSAHMVR